MEGRSAECGHTGAGWEGRLGGHILSFLPAWEYTKYPVSETNVPCGLPLVLTDYPRHRDHSVDWCSHQTEMSEVQTSDVFPWVLLRAQPKGGLRKIQ